MNGRRAFFRTGPSTNVLVIVGLAAVCLVLSCVIAGTPATHERVGDGRITIEHTGIADWARLGFFLLGIALVALAGVLHSNEVTTPDVLEADRGGRNAGDDTRVGLAPLPPPPEITRW